MVISESLPSDHTTTFAEKPRVRVVWIRLYAQKNDRQLLSPFLGHTHLSYPILFYSMSALPFTAWTSASQLIPKINIVPLIDGYQRKSLGAKIWTHESNYKRAFNNINQVKTIITV